MAIGSDVVVDKINKVIRRSAAPSATVYSVNALYSYLMDYFDELVMMSSQMPMKAPTPTSYTMVNGWYIQEELTQFLDGGAIQTTGYLNTIQVLTLDGSYTPALTTDLGKPVNDDASPVGALLDYDNTAQKWWVRSSTTIANNSAMTIAGGAGVGSAAADSLTGETKFANPYTLGAMEGTPAIYIYQAGQPITSWWANGHFDILVKMTEASVDIDSKKITVTARTWTDTYSTYELILTTAGQNAVPLSTGDDGNNTSSEATVEDLQDGTTATIAIDFSFSSPYTYDIGDGNGAQPYDVRIDCNGRPLSDVYEVVKYWTRDGSVKQLETNTDSNFINGEAYRYADSSYAEVTASPLGTFPGGKFIAAQGVYFINLHADDAQAFELIDNNGVSRIPPNYQSFAIGGLVSGRRVTVHPESGGDVNTSQYSLNGANPLNTITVTGAIPNDTPTTGIIFVVDDDGSEIGYAYSAWSGSNFTVTISAGVYSGTETAYVPYVYAQATGTSVTETVIYVSDRAVITRVREAGVEPYETVGVFGSTGYTATATSQTDSIYTP